MADRTCSRCGHQAAHGDRFCTRCGTERVPATTRPNGSDVTGAPQGNRSSLALVMSAAGLAVALVVLIVAIASTRGDSTASTPSSTAETVVVSATEPPVTTVSSVAASVPGTEPGETTTSTSAPAEAPETEVTAVDEAFSAAEGALAERSAIQRSMVSSGPCGLKAVVVYESIAELLEWDGMAWRPWIAPFDEPRLGALEVLTVDLTGDGVLDFVIVYEDVYQGRIVGLALVSDPASPCTWLQPDVIDQQGTISWVLYGPRLGAAGELLADIDRADGSRGEGRIVYEVSRRMLRVEPT
jgi:hypothetical protein